MGPSTKQTMGAELKRMKTLRNYRNNECIFKHNEQIGKWLSPEETRKNDLYKMKCANDNGFSIIRILQKDVYFNKYDWLNELCENIEKISEENRVQNIYMCKNNEYKDFDI
jgi:hypothetical protein